MAKCTGVHCTQSENQLVLGVSLGAEGEAGTEDLCSPPCAFLHTHTLLSHKADETGTPSRKADTLQDTRQVSRQTFPAVSLCRLHVAAQAGLGATRSHGADPQSVSPSRCEDSAAVGGARPARLQARRTGAHGEVRQTCPQKPP